MNITELISPTVTNRIFCHYAGFWFITFKILFELIRQIKQKFTFLFLRTGTRTVFMDRKVRRACTKLPKGHTIVQLGKAHHVIM